MEAQPLTLGDDQPKTNPWRDDRLGYAPFAQQLSKILVSLQTPNGYVVGLHGKWGSGKSTVLNFTKAYIQKHNEETDGGDKLTVIDFRPWIVSGHQDLIVAFFKVLSENLGPADSSWRRWWKKMLGFVKGTTDSAVDAAAKVALAIDPSGGVATGFAGALAKKSVSGLIARFLETPSLQKSYEDLSEQLRRSGRRFLVPIDDLDRLQSREIREIMQMVKTLGRLPNIVYMLTYDREIVWNSLDQGLEREGPRYAEKIVQQEIELPKLSRNSLLAILDQEISFLAGDTGSSLRWQYILRDGIHRWIRLPRDVLRLTNAVKFSWPALAGEIDPQDLLAMEGLRLFDEQAYYWVRDNRDFLFGEGRFVLAEEGVRESAIEMLKGRLPNETRDQLLHLLSILFPLTAKWFQDGNVFSQESRSELGKRRGIGSEAGYDAYFGLRPSTDEVPKAIIDDMILKIEDANALAKAMRTYLGKTNSRREVMIGKVLEELRYRFESPERPLPTSQLLDALFSVGEDVLATDWSGEMFTLSPRAHIEFLIDSLLKAWGEDEAGKRLVAAFEKATSPAFCADVFVSRGRELGVFDADSRQSPLISMDDFAQLGLILLLKIRESSKNGTLSDAPFYFDIVRSWGYLEGSEPPREWLSSGMQASARFLARVGKGLVSYSVSNSNRSYRMRQKPEESLYDLHVLLESAHKHRNDPGIGDDDRSLITELERGAEEFLQSKTDTRSANTKLKG